MSAPQVTGAVVLMLAKDADLTAAQVKARLIAGADQSAALVGTSAAAGELNVANAIAGTTGQRYNRSGAAGTGGGTTVGRPGRFWGSPWRRYSIFSSSEIRVDFD